MSIRVLHIGDFHFWRFPLNPVHYVGKRLLGVGNLAVRRARSFRISRAPSLVERIGQLEPDWVALSGDFTTTSLPGEFSRARVALNPVVATQGLADRVRAVPGNHDRYTPTATRSLRFEGTFADWCQGGRWPYIEDLGEGVRLLGIDATTPNGMGSHGQMTSEILGRAKELWEAHRDGAEELWILCHFPAEDPPGAVATDRGIQLRGAGPMVKWVEALGVRTFYLHGHHHYRWLFTSERAPNLTYVNAGAPFLRHGRIEPDLGLMALEREAGGQTRLTLHTAELMQGAQWHTAEVPLPRPGHYINLQKDARKVAEEMAEGLRDSATLGTLASRQASLSR
ncbi:MAG: metallophosphoesterase [Sumerlaeia bacterium]